jgi:hypothetical protein
LAFLDYGLALAFRRCRGFSRPPTRCDSPHRLARIRARHLPRKRVRKETASHVSSHASGGGVEPIVQASRMGRFDQGALSKQVDRQRPRASRIISVGEGDSSTGGSASKRARISAIDGRSAILRASLVRKSESDRPSRAARALSFRCSASGTLRNWIILDMRNADIHMWNTFQRVA